MADLDLNLEDLRALADDLTSIRSEFENADDNAEDAAEATGHDELRDIVNDFADEWRIKRGDMMEDLSKLTDVINQIADSFTELDTELGNALEDGAKGKG